MCVHAASMSGNGYLIMPKTTNAIAEIIQASPQINDGGTLPGVWWIKKDDLIDALANHFAAEVHKHNPFCVNCLNEFDRDKFISACYGE